MKETLMTQNRTPAEAAASSAPPGKITLAEQEKWLENNPEARAQIERGLADLAAGRVVAGLSFTEYAKDDVED